MGPASIPYVSQTVLLRNPANSCINPASFFPDTARAELAAESIDSGVGDVQSSCAINVIARRELSGLTPLPHCAVTAQRSVLGSFPSDTAFGASDRRAARAFRHRVLRSVWRRPPGLA